jgi:hypothetical protein
VVLFALFVRWVQARRAAPAPAPTPETERD